MGYKVEKMCCIGTPGQYLQGAGALRRLGECVKRLGTGLFLITDTTGAARIEKDVNAGMQGAGRVEYVLFEKMCSEREIRLLAERFAQSGCQVVAGAGGGKHLDAAKAVAAFAHAPMVMLPTVASTDAPCSALSVLYTDEGLFDRYLYLEHNPDVVLVDTAYIAAAPVRLLVSGMGDALATWFEARACAQSGGVNEFGSCPGTAALCLAQGCWNNLRLWGKEALAEMQAKKPGKAVERIVETNIYLSGIGFESGGLAAAHAVNNGLAGLSRGAKSSHGEKVAFGTLVQLMLEQRLGGQSEQAAKELEQVRQFCCEVGLPTHLAQLGFEGITRQELEQMASIALSPADHMKNMPFAVTKEDLIQAVLAVDTLAGQDDFGTEREREGVR